MEYLENTVHHLRNLGVTDRGLERLLKEVARRRKENDA
jgi:cation transport regulator ChaC